MKIRMTMGLLGAVLLVGCRAPAQRADRIEDLIEAVPFALPVDLDWTYLLPVEGSTPFVAKLILHNSPPIRASDPGFPSDYCPSNAVFYATAKGEGAAIEIGRFVYSEKYCGIPGSRVISDVVFTSDDGNELYATALASAGPTIPPPFPHATFTGTYTITGGTGRFRNAMGKASIAGQQLGDRPEPDMPANIPGATAIGLAGWIDLESSETSQHD